MDSTAHQTREALFKTLLADVVELKKQLADAKRESEINFSLYKSHLQQKWTIQNEVKLLEKEILEHRARSNRLNDRVSVLLDANEALREGLLKVQYADNPEDSCDNPDHEISDDEIHSQMCIGCGKFKCEPCRPDCWLLLLASVII